jgi:4-aminobutyrate aminotransferase/(S)-3-amino-2-methylpropionate transaminase
MRELDLAAAARRIEGVLMPALREMDGIEEVRGRGAMVAIELADAPRAAAVAAACHAAGLLILTCGTYGNVLRFLPPLVISDDDLRRGLDIVRTALVP